MINLLELPHSRARALLATGAPVFLPVNPVEYHGPHLSLHNDSLISRGIARDIHEVLRERGHDWPLLVASDLEIGVEPCPGPGSRSTPYGAASRLVMEACQRLVELGAQRVVLTTFHGSPLHSLALHAGVELLRAHGVQALSPLNLLLRAMLELEVSQFADAYATIADERVRTALMASAALDFHAGFFETSLALHHAPESVDPAYTTLPPCPDWAPDPVLERAGRAAARVGQSQLALELGFAASGAGWYTLRPFPGYTSSPHLASAQAGARFAAHMKTWFGSISHDVLFGGAPPPEPIMPWLPKATLRGRLGGAHVPLAAIGSGM
jgi:creatinine amidohydrolase